MTNRNTIITILIFLLIVVAVPITILLFRQQAQLQSGAEGECSYNNLTQIRNTNNQVIPAQGFRTATTVDGIVADKTIHIYDTASGKAQSGYNTEELPDFLKNANEILVELTTLPDGYTLVGSFCEGTEGCPDNAGDPVYELGSFDMSCDQNITYGWIVSREETPQPPRTGSAYLACGVSASDVRDDYDPIRGVYSTEFDLTNTNDETIIINAQRYACRCAEGLGLNSADLGFEYEWQVCIGDWPNPLGNPSDPGDVKMNCEYEDETVVLTPGETRTITVARGTPLNQVYDPNCGSFQTDWMMKTVEPETGGGVCYPADEPNLPAFQGVELLNSYGVLFTAKDFGGADCTSEAPPPGVCPHVNTTQIRYEDNTVVKSQGFYTVSTVDGVISPSTTHIYKDSTNGATVTYEPPNGLPDPLKNATDITVELTTIPNGFEVVGTFCEGGAGCPDNAGDATYELTGFDLDCNQNFTYGWIVSSEEPPPPSDYVCDDSGACVEKTSATDSRKSCGADSAGQSVAECMANYCVVNGSPITTKVVSSSNPVCENLPIESVNSNALTCTNVTDCVIGEGDKTYTTCDYDAELCIEKTTAGEIPPEAVLCTPGPDPICRVHNVCTDLKTCEIRGCDANDTECEDECLTPKDCIETYLACVNNACVNLFGNKEPQCVDDEDCFPEIPPPGGVEGAVLAIALISVGLVFLGLVLLR